MRTDFHTPSLIDFSQRRIYHMHALCKYIHNIHTYVLVYYYYYYHTGTVSCMRNYYYTRYNHHHHHHQYHHHVQRLKRICRRVYARLRGCAFQRPWEKGSHPVLMNTARRTRRRRATVSRIRVFFRHMGALAIYRYLYIIIYCIITHTVAILYRTQYIILYFSCQTRYYFVHRNRLKTVQPDPRTHTHAELIITRVFFLDRRCSRARSRRTMCIRIRTGHGRLISNKRACSVHTGA